MFIQLCLMALSINNIWGCRIIKCIPAKYTYSWLLHHSGCFATTYKFKTIFFMFRGTAGSYSQTMLAGILMMKIIQDRKPDILGTLTAFAIK